MAFNCNILLEDIDINCNKHSNVGGIKKAIIMLQSDITIAFNPSDETEVVAVQTSNEKHFKHIQKDNTTSFSESKTTENGLGVVNTTITIQIPSITRNLNKLDYFSRREDLVCVLLHNNESVTISGWLDGLCMNLNANSGSSITGKSVIDVELYTESGMASLVVNDKSFFADQTIFD